jgi:hypothetical protein
MQCFLRFTDIAYAGIIPVEYQQISCYVAQTLCDAARRLAGPMTDCLPLRHHHLLKNGNSTSGAWKLSAPPRSLLTTPAPHRSWKLTSCMQHESGDTRTMSAVSSQPIRTRPFLPVWCNERTRGGKAVILHADRPRQTSPGQSPVTTLTHHFPAVTFPNPQTPGWHLEQRLSTRAVANHSAASRSAAIKTTPCGTPGPALDTCTRTPGRVSRRQQHVKAAAF